MRGSSVHGRAPYGKGGIFVGLAYLGWKAVEPRSVPAIRRQDSGIVPSMTETRITVSPILSSSS
jgi:hypothetical protein